MSPQKQAAVDAANFVQKVNTEFLFPLIALLSAVAFLVFMYGALLYVFNGANDQARETGKKHITYGIIGLVIMVSAYGFLTIAVNTFGLGGTLDCTTDPINTPGCDKVFNPPNKN